LKQGTNNDYLWQIVLGRFFLSDADIVLSEKKERQFLSDEIEEY
jgi:hypothetical protein